MNRSTLNLLAALIVMATACTTNEPGGLPATFPFRADARLDGFSDVFSTVDTLVLEENDSVVTAQPIVRYDGQHFLVADPHAFQVRIYTKRGELLRAMGRMGQGPGEFLTPLSARRTTDGGVLVVDLSTFRMTLFSANPAASPKVLAVPVLAGDVVDLGDSRYLVAGPALDQVSNPSRQLLHLWKAGSEGEAVEHSFFPFRAPDPIADFISAARPLPEVFVRNDTIWAVQPMSDSVYKLHLDGTQLDALPLPLAGQLHLAESPDGQHWSIFGLHVLDDGRLVVQVMTEVAPRELIYNLVVMDEGGTVQAMLADTPPLRTVADGVFYFQDPERLEPNRWIATRLKVQSSGSEPVPGGGAQAMVGQAGSDRALRPRPWASGPWLAPVMEAASQEDVQLSRVDGLGIASDGRVYAADARTKGVVVLAPDLTYERTIGRLGRGPGEFRSVTVVQVLPGDSLFIFDQDLQRATLFAPGAEELEYARPVWGGTATDAGALKPASAVHRLPGRAGFMGVFRLAYMASGSDVGERRYDVLRHLYEDDGVQHADSLFGAPSGQTLVVRVGARDGGVVHVAAHPFGRRSYWQLMGGDRLVYAHSQEVGAQVVDLDGQVVSAFSYAVAPVPVEDAELGAATDGMEPEMARTLRREGPYSWPPVAALATDDMGRIWLAIRGEDRSVLEWAAFTEDGTHVASVLFPARFRLLAARDGRLVGVHRDDYDIPQIRAYRLEATE